MDTPVIDNARLEAFAMRAVGDIAAAYAGVMVSLGAKLGLYRAMAGAGPLSAKEVARRARCAERYVRGAYAAARPGKAAARQILARPVAERIFFAGEHLAGPLIQTCGGARLSGEAVAPEGILAGRGRDFYRAFPQNSPTRSFPKERCFSSDTSVKPAAS